MPLQAGLLRAVGGLPQDDAAIVAATGQARSVRTPRHPTDRGWLPMTHPSAGARAHFPHPHPLLISPPPPKTAPLTPPPFQERGIDQGLGAPRLHHSLSWRVPPPDR